MIRLVPKPDRDLQAWFTAMWDDYRKDLLDTGFNPAEALLNIEQNKKALFVNGMPNDDQRIFDVWDGETKVGDLWLATRERQSAGEWYVYNVVVDEEFRGRGLGRATMLAAEDYVKGQGGTRLALNVFGPNVVARGLYESLGYQTMAIAMRKDLT